MILVKRLNFARFFVKNNTAKNTTKPGNSPGLLHCLSNGGGGPEFYEKMLSQEQNP